MNRELLKEKTPQSVLLREAWGVLTYAIVSSKPRDTISRGVRTGDTPSLAKIIRPTEIKKPRIEIRSPFNM